MSKWFTKTHLYAVSNLSFFHTLWNEKYLWQISFSEIKSSPWLLKGNLIKVDNFFFVQGEIIYIFSLVKIFLLLIAQINAIHYVHLYFFLLNQVLFFLNVFKLFYRNLVNFLYNQAYIKLISHSWQSQN